MELFKSRARVVYTNAVGDKVYPVVVDIKKGIKSTEEVTFVSSDINTGILSAAFVQGNEVYNVSGAEVVCSVMRPDASTLEIPCEVVSGNIVEVPLGVNGTSQDGVYSMDFKIFKGGNKVVGTPIMNYSVSLSIGNDMAVEEDDRLPVLTMLMTQVGTLKEEATSVISQANDTIELARVATNNAVDATNNANATIEEVKVMTNEAVSRVDNSISVVNNTVNEKVVEMNTAKVDMTNTVSNKINEVEKRFNNLTSSQQQSSEVIDARDGEVSLKARLDRDIEKAKEIYVGVEGTYVSTDSSSGYAKYVEILGNTIQNAENLADIRSVGDKVEGQELYEIPVLSTGANIINPLEFSKPDSYNVCSLFVKVKPSTKYKIRYIDNSITSSIVDIVELNSKGETVVSSRGVWHNSYITTNENTVQVKIKTQSSRIDKVIMSEGDYEFEPYQGDKLTILSPVQLEKVGDVADRIIEKDGVWGVEKNVGTVVFDGSESNWSVRSVEGTGKTSFGKPLYGVKPCENHLIAAVICDKFTVNSTTKVYECLVDGVAINKNSWIYFSLNSEIANDSSTFSQWLQANPTLVKYQTTQPQFIPLPHDQQVKLRTFAGQTNIHFETEIQGTIKAQVPKSLGATVNSHTEQIGNLSKELDRVKKLEESTVSTVTTESDFTTVEETSNGYFEDVKLEGKTLVNLALPGINPIYFNINMFKTPCEYTVAITFDSNKSCTLWVEQVDTWKYVYRNDSVQQGGNYVVFKFNSTDFDLTKSFALSNRVSGIYDSTVVYSNIKMVILEGDHTQNPPSYFEGLKSVGQSASEDGVDEIVVSSVKGDGNLFDGQLEEVSIETTYNGKFGQLIPSSSDFCSHTKPFMIKPNTTYVVGINDTTRQALCFMYDYNMNPLNFEYGNGSKEFTTPSNARYCRVRFGLILTEAMNYEMYLIEKDSTDLTHQSDKKPLLYFNPTTETWEKPILRQWDSIEKHADGKYYYHQRSGEVVLNGSEGWNILKTNTNHSIFTYRVSDALKKTDYCAITNRFTQVPNTLESLAREEEFFLTDIGGGINISIENPKLSQTNVDGFKQWLQANNVTVVYQLAQEKVYECTNLDLITYENETNYIVSSGVIVPKTTLKVHNNISNVVKILQEKVSLLENKFIEGLKKVLAGDMYSLAELLYPEDFKTENSVMTIPLN